MSHVTHGSMLSLLGVPPTRIPIDVPVFVSLVLPPLVCYFTLAALAVMPQTRTARVVLWPIFASLALRAAASVDVSQGKAELRVGNGVLACILFILGARALDWTLAREPLVRHLRPGNGSSSTIMDALDLSVNFRGYGWNWSHGFSFPQDTRPKGRIVFALYAFLSAVANMFVFGVSQRATLLLRAPDCTTTGSGLFDETLTFFVPYLRRIIPGFTQYIAGYSSLQAGYDLCTTIGVLFLGQDSPQWPPAFDAPWRATSLGEFWGRRWQQWFRHTFIFLGGRPFQSYLGRPGIIFGGFMASAVMHAILAIGSGIKEDAWMVSSALAVMAPLVLAERVFHSWTGNKVGGLCGWIWTIVWLLVTGSWSSDAWAKMGGVGDSCPMEI